MRGWSTFQDGGVAQSHESCDILILDIDPVWGYTKHVHDAFFDLSCERLKSEMTLTPENRCL